MLPGVGPDFVIFDHFGPWPFWPHTVTEDGLRAHSGHGLPELSLSALALGIFSLARHSCAIVHATLVALGCLGRLCDETAPRSMER